MGLVFRCARESLRTSPRVPGFDLDAPVLKFNKHDSISWRDMPAALDLSICMFASVGIGGKHLCRSYWHRLQCVIGDIEMDAMLYLDEDADRDVADEIGQLDGVIRVQSSHLDGFVEYVALGLSVTASLTTIMSTILANRSVSRNAYLVIGGKKHLLAEKSQAELKNILEGHVSHQAISRSDTNHPADANEASDDTAPSPGSQHSGDVSPS